MFWFYKYNKISTCNQALEIFNELIPHPTPQGGANDALWVSHLYLQNNLIEDLEVLSVIKHQLGTASEQLGTEFRLSPWFLPRGHLFTTALDLKIKNPDVPLGIQLKRQSEEGQNFMY